MARWLGRDSVEIIAGFCQSRLDGFYKEFARLNDKPAARYFVEKCPPGPGWRLAGELYPQGREIFLVRDFRDRACSVLEFTARRGLDLWGRKPDRTDAEWFEFLRDEALGFLGWWRQRRAHAHLVRYEDLITEPDRTLATVFSYLGVDAGSGAVRQAIDAATAWNPQAQKEHATSTSAEASIGRWRQDLSPERQAACAEAFDDVLSEFGYEPTTAT
jgi:hypothetical protein